MKQIIKNEFLSHLEIANLTITLIQDNLELAGQLIIETLKNGNKILICGNGGSAADAQHIATEIVCKYKANKKGLPAIALTTDTSIITAISNDFGFERVFERQIEALANKDDLVIAISTSGNSSNIINAVKYAKEIQCKTLGFSGNNGGKMNDFCDINLIIPSKDTARIQEMHILIAHILCQIIDTEFK